MARIGKEKAMQIATELLIDIASGLIVGIILQVLF